MKKVICSAIILATFISLGLQAKETIYYKENKGQWPAPVQYRMDMNSSTLFIEESGITYVVYDAHVLHELHEKEHEGVDVMSIPIDYHAYKVSFEGAQAAQFETKNQAAHHENYFTGNDPEKWGAKVGLFGEVLMTDLYEGIDARLYSEDLFFKYDWIVAPGANSSVIKMNYDGVDRMELNDGNLMLVTSVNEIIEECPYAYQIVNGVKQQVSCQYRLEGNSVGFDFPDGYDENYTLYIDPIVMASTASGSTTSNFGHSASYDLDGNIYTGARSFGTGYPTTVGAFQETFGNGVDMGISKLDPTGSNLIWASYLGGSAAEYPHSMFVNDNQEIAVYGNTASTNYPTSAGAYDTSHNGGNDICLTVLSADGSALIGSTYLGGAGEDGAANANYINYDDGYRGEIIVDDNDNVYLAAFTKSADFPTTAGAYETSFQGSQDAVLVKLPQDLSSLTWSTFFGGSGDDAGYGLRVNETYDVFFTGPTTSTDLPTTVGAYQSTYGGGDQDGYVVRLSDDGTSLLAATYIGTDEEDASFFLDMDSNDNVYIFGQSDGAFPVTGGVYGQTDGKIFITQFDENLTNIQISTRLLEGSGFGFPVVPTAFLVDECSNVYLSGYSAQAGFETTPDAVYTTGQFYILVLEPDMTGLLYATYYTGDHVDGGTSRFDQRGIIYQAVCNANGFFIDPGAYSANVAGGYDVCVFKIDLELSGVIAELDLDIEDAAGCSPFTVDFSNTSINANSYEWDFGDGEDSNIENPIHTYTSAGEYIVRLIAKNTETCNQADTTHALISVFAPHVSFSRTPEFLCIGQEAQFTDTSINPDDPVVGWEWDFGDGETSTEQNPKHSYENVGIYTVSLTITTEEGCMDTYTVENAMEVILLEADFTADREVCIDNEVSFRDLTIVPEYLEWGPIISWEWDFGDGQTSTEESPTHKYDATGFYDISLVVQTQNGCELVRTMEDFVEIYDVYADFEANQYQLTNFSYPWVEFYNYSDGATNYLWTIDGVITYDTENVTHMFSLAPGVHTVSLQVDRGGCVDEIEKTIEVINLRSVFVPTVFTPNADGINEFFIPNGEALDKCYSYEFKIYDRWGKEMFFSNDKTKGWSGMDKEGVLSEQGVYVWKLKFYTKHRELKNLTGTVTLLR